MNELSQAYKYLANFYLKKMKLDNAYDAATKCLEFAEVIIDFIYLTRLLSFFNKKCFLDTSRSTKYSKSNSSNP